MEKSSLPDSAGALVDPAEGTSIFPAASTMVEFPSTNSMHFNVASESEVPERVAAKARMIETTISAADTESPTRHPLPNADSTLAANSSTRKLYKITSVEFFGKVLAFFYILLLTLFI